MQLKNALIIFTRNPELGKCKTRLAKTVGDQSALAIYKHLLNHTKNVVLKVRADRFVYYSETPVINDIWDSEHFIKKQQNGTELGERMYNAFKELFDLGYTNVAIIGSDLLDLRYDLIEDSFLKLIENDFVIGPAEDGGYFLMAMKSLEKSVFMSKKWGTATVLNDTLNDLRHHTIYLLEKLNDIDTFEDMKDYKDLDRFYKKP